MCNLAWNLYASVANVIHSHSKIHLVTNTYLCCGYKSRIWGSQQCSPTARLPSTGWLPLPEAHPRLWNISDALSEALQDGHPHVLKRFPFGAGPRVSLVSWKWNWNQALKNEASSVLPGRWLHLSPVQNNSRSAPSRTSPQYRNMAITRFALCLKVKHYHFADYIILKIQRPNPLDILPSSVLYKSFHHVQFTGQL